MKKIKSTDKGNYTGKYKKQYKYTFFGNSFLLNLIKKYGCISNSFNTVLMGL